MRPRELRVIEPCLANDGGYDVWLAREDAVCSMHETERVVPRQRQVAQHGQAEGHSNSPPGDRPDLGEQVVVVHVSKLAVQHSQRAREHDDGE